MTFLSFFSKDLFVGDSTQISGMAYVGGVCEDDYKYLIVEDDGSSSTANVGT